ncbi:MAG: UbiA family prenyltransferase [Saprospiraceae bacterium]|nr:UbiA family prenyltransferase [Saprospiraceae bacterium]
MSILRKTIDLFLYGNFLIALCAASLAYQVFLLDHHFSWYTPYPFFIFFATLFLYSAHRIIGFTKLGRTHPNRRMSVIIEFQLHIIIYAVISFTAMLAICCQLSFKVIENLLFPGLLALLYVLPIFNNQKRIRDLPYVKLFIIGLVWTWVCVVIPLKDENINLSGQHWLIIIEKCLFIIAITIPFDIRDLRIDQLHEIKTIPTILGPKKSIILSITLLLLAWMGMSFNYLLLNLNYGVWLALSISYLFSMVVVGVSKEGSHDYYFSGLLDGSILLQFLLILLIA